MYVPVVANTSVLPALGSAPAEIDCAEVGHDGEYWAGGEGASSSSGPGIASGSQEDGGIRRVNAMAIRLAFV